MVQLIINPPLTLVTYHGSTEYICQQQVHTQSASMGCMDGYAQHASTHTHACMHMRVDQNAYYDFEHTSVHNTLEHPQHHLELGESTSATVLSDYDNHDHGYPGTARSHPSSM